MKRPVMLPQKKKKSFSFFVVAIIGNMYNFIVFTNKLSNQCFSVCLEANIKMLLCSESITTSQDFRKVTARQQQHRFQLSRPLGCDLI